MELYFADVKQVFTSSDLLDEVVDDEADHSHEDPQEQNEQPVHNVGQDFSRHTVPSS